MFLFIPASLEQPKEKTPQPKQPLAQPPLPVQPKQQPPQQQQQPQTTPVIKTENNNEEVETITAVAVSAVDATEPYEIS